MTDASTIPAFPRIEATIVPTTDDRATGVLVVNGVPMPFEEATEDDIRRSILSSVRGTAEQMHRAVRLTTHDRYGTQELAVSPNGVTQPLTDLDQSAAIPAAPVETVPVSPDVVATPAVDAPAPTPAPPPKPRLAPPRADAQPGSRSSPVRRSRSPPPRASAVSSPALGSASPRPTPNASSGAGCAP